MTEKPICGVPVISQLLQLCMQSQVIGPLPQLFAVHEMSSAPPSLSEHTCPDWHVRPPTAWAHVTVLQAPVSTVQVPFWHVASARFPLGQPS
jgi:hypothetical protein